MGPTAVFPLGSTTVTVTATDASGNSASDTVVVMVATVVTTVTNETPPDIDATAEADTEVSFSGTGDVTGTIGVAKYEEEPTAPTIAFSAGTGKEPLKFIDVWVSGFTEGTATVKVHYTDDEVAGFAEESLCLYYWNGDSWEPAANSSVDTDNNIVSGDIPVSALAGTPIGAGGDLAARFPMGLVGGLIGGAVVIGLAVYFLAVRRRRARAV